MPPRLTVVLVSLLLTSPVVIFWLWLVILPARVAKLCPEKCRCDPGGYNVKCDGTSLNRVPLIHLTSVRDIDLKENNITFLERDSFVLLTEMQNLHLWRCGLRTIKMGAFKGLTKLTRLSIGGNEISEIKPGTFENVMSLEILYLDDNRIEHVNRDTFSGLFKVKYVSLSKNKLKYLHPDTFLRLPKLQELHLTNNPGLKVPTDRNFIKSHSLLHLDISLCNISSVSVETFANVSALEWLDLSNNNLKTLNITILTTLPKLSTLYLFFNPLHCDCQLQEVWRLCKDRNMWPGNHVRCNIPSEVNGIVWAVLDKGQCLQDNIQYNGGYKNYTDT